jgi:hypothetical protein
MSLLCFMPRLLVPTLVVLAATASVISLTFPIPMHSIATSVSSSVLTAINPEILLEYSTSTLACGSSPQTCYEQIVEYTTTARWSGQTTHAETLTLTSVTSVLIAFSGLWGNALAVLFLFLLLISAALLAKSTFFRRKGRTN